MNCQECNKRPATVHFTKIVNGEKLELKLCELCAKERGDIDFGYGEHFSFHKLLAGLLDIDEFQVMGEKIKERAKCPKCGLTDGKFVGTGRLGCDKCYDIFGSKLNPLLRRIHGSANHVGKVPVRTGGKIRLKKEIHGLREKMNLCISTEDFEQAAQLRDKIKDLEKRQKEGE